MPECQLDFFSLFKHKAWQWNPKGATTSDNDLNNGMWMELSLEMNVIKWNVSLSLINSFSLRVFTDNKALIL